MAFWKQVAKKPRDDMLLFRVQHANSGTISDDSGGFKARSDQSLTDDESWGRALEAHLGRDNQRIPTPFISVYSSPRKAADRAEDAISNGRRDVYIAVINPAVCFKKVLKVWDLAKYLRIWLSDKDNFYTACEYLYMRNIPYDAVEEKYYNIEQFRKDYITERYFL